MPRQPPPPSAVHCPLGRGVIRLPREGSLSLFFFTLRDGELALWPRESAITGSRIARIRGEVSATDLQPEESNERSAQSALVAR